MAAAADQPALVLDPHITQRGGSTRRGPDSCGSAERSA